MGFWDVRVVWFLAGGRIWRRGGLCTKASGWGVAIMKGPMNAIQMISRLNGEHDGLGRR